MARNHYFNITYRCNSNCSFCAADLRVKDSKEMPVQVFESILDRLSIEPSDTVTINGGEPTVHPDFFGFLSAVKRKNAKITLFTNGRKFADTGFAKDVAFFSPIDTYTGLFNRA